MRHVFAIFVCLVFLSASFAQSGKNRPVETGDGKKTGRSSATPGAPQVGSPENPQPPIEEDPEAIKVETDLVSFPVSVFDRQGRYVLGLRKQDFQVFEDGKPQQIEFFGDLDQPFTVALALDTSLSTKFKIGEIHRAAIAFVNQLRPQDRVMVISFAEEIYELSDLTGDREQLKLAILRARFQQGTSLYDTLGFIINKRLKTIAGRKAVVLFTDGVDTTSRLSSAADNMADAEELDALIYPIRYDTFADVQKIEREGTATRSPLPLPTPPPSVALPPAKPVILDEPVRRDPGDPGRESPIGKNKGTTLEDYKVAENYLEALARSTGTRVRRADNLYDLDAAFAQIAAELRQQYSLGYYPPNTEDRKSKRKVKVKVSREKVTVRARDSYVLGQKPKK